VSGDPVISEADVRAYVDAGYLVVPNLVGPGDLEAIGAELMKFAAGDYPSINPPTPSKEPDEAGPAADILAVHFPHWVSPIIHDMILHAEIVAVLERITGAHLPHWDGRVKCMQSMLFAKPPGLQGQAWHQDERYIATRDRSLVGAWIAVDDATEENGCLRVIPGSQRSGYLWPTGPHGEPDEFDLADESHGFDASGEVLVEVEAGSVVFFNGYTLHRSKRNRSGRFRRALVNHYCNAWSLLPWAASPRGKIHPYEIATHDERNVVPVGEDPYAEKGYGTLPEKVFIRPHTAKDPLSSAFSNTTKK
jgi:ectoine hydroxylase-related dioxygenase (phytanoyl-CoA dioxygenase family)